MNTLAASSPATANPLALPSRPCRRRRTSRVKSPRLALVEARPGPPVPVIRDGTARNDSEKAAALVLRTATGEVYPVPFSRDRTEDMQAEVSAMARAANASVYSPELLAAKYGSRPIKVSIYKKWKHRCSLFQIWASPANSRWQAFVLPLFIGIAQGTRNIYWTWIICLKSVARPIERAILSKQEISCYSVEADFHAIGSYFCQNWPGFVHPAGPVSDWVSWRAVWVAGTCVFVIFWILYWCFTKNGFNLSSYNCWENRVFPTNSN